MKRRYKKNFQEVLPKDSLFIIPFLKKEISTKDLYLDFIYYNHFSCIFFVKRREEASQGILRVLTKRLTCLCFAFA